MAAAGRGTTHSVKRASALVLETLHPRSVAARLLTRFFEFDFFQAVRILEQLDQERVHVGHAGPPAQEVVRFKAHASLSFPPSAIANFKPPTRAVGVPTMTVPFMGLTGP